jgi:hypothetical protein
MPLHIDVYTNENTSGFVGLIGAAVVAAHGVGNNVVLRSLLLMRMPFYEVTERVGLLGRLVHDAKFCLLCFPVLTCLCGTCLHVEGG